MKIRQGFVSNSSSSSFIVNKNCLTEEQIRALHVRCITPIGKYNDNWILIESPNFVSGYTYMDNGQDEDGLEAWLKNNDYPMSEFEWERD